MPEQIDVVPDEIRPMMQERELHNIQYRNGWAVGDVSRVENMTVVETVEDVLIELFNGNGCAGEFGGVRFVAIDEDGEYREAYAYGSFGSMQSSLASDGWYVESFSDPEDPDVGQEAPA